MLGWLYVHLGLGNASGAWYLFWSGIGSDLGYLGIFTSLFVKHNCHQRRCWRIGHHAVERDGHKYVVCRKHAGAPKLGKDDA